jgi:CubicO group peptidase (beta-lactamase class C family)
MKVGLPLDHSTLIRFVLERPLQFAPGERFAYSNFGYCLLGRVIERISGLTYEQYVGTQVLAPLGIKRMRLGRTQLAQRATEEVTYHDDRVRTAATVLDRTGQQVPLPYGA